MTDVDDWDDYIPDDEPDEPDWGYWDEVVVGGRARRRAARRWRHQLRLWRKVERHSRDRFWQARNRPAFDEEAPF
jgi:hypothetical protein